MSYSEKIDEKCHADFEIPRSDIELIKSFFNDFLSTYDFKLKTTYYQSHLIRDIRKTGDWDEDMEEMFKNAVNKTGSVSYLIGFLSKMCDDFNYKVVSHPKVRAKIVVVPKSSGFKFDDVVEHIPAKKPFNNVKKETITLDNIYAILVDINHNLIALKK